MTGSRRTTIEEARRVGDEIGVDWQQFDLEQFRFGMDVEFEHGSHDPQTDVTGDDPILTGKIALAHMKEFAQRRANARGLVSSRVKSRVLDQWRKALCPCRHN